MTQSFEWQYSTLPEDERRKKSVQQSPSLPLDQSVGSVVLTSSDRKRTPTSSNAANDGKPRYLTPTGASRAKSPPRARKAVEVESNTPKSPSQRAQKKAAARTKTMAEDGTRSVREMIKDFHTNIDRKERFGLERVIMRKAAIASDLNQAPPTSGVTLIEMMSDRRIPAKAHWSIAENCPAGPLGFDAVQRQAFKAHHRKERAKLEGLSVASTAEINEEDRSRDIHTPVEPEIPNDTTISVPPLGDPHSADHEDDTVAETVSREEGGEGTSEALPQGVPPLHRSSAALNENNGSRMIPLDAQRKSFQRTDKIPGRERPDSIDVRTMRPLAEVGVVTLAPMSIADQEAERRRKALVVNRAKQEREVARKAKQLNGTPVGQATKKHPTFGATISGDGAAFNPSDTFNLTSMRRALASGGALSTTSFDKTLAGGGPPMTVVDGTFARDPELSNISHSADPTTVEPNVVTLSESEQERRSSPFFKLQGPKSYPHGTRGAETPSVDGQQVEVAVPSFYQVSPRGTPAGGSRGGRISPLNSTSRRTPTPTGGGTLSMSNTGAGGPGGGSTPATPAGQSWKSSSITRDILIRQVEATFRAKEDQLSPPREPHDDDHRVSPTRFTSSLPPISVSSATLRHLKATGKIPNNATSKTLKLASSPPLAGSSAVAALSRTGVRSTHHNRPLKTASGGSMNETFGPFGNSLLNAQSFSPAGCELDDPTTEGQGGASETQQLPQRGWGLDGPYQPLSDLEKTRVDFNFVETNPEWCWLFNGKEATGTADGDEEGEPIFYFSDGRDDDTMPDSEHQVSTVAVIGGSSGTNPFLTQTLDEEELTWNSQQQSLGFEEHQQKQTNYQSSMGMGGDYRQRKRAEARDAARDEIRNRRNHIRTEGVRRLAEMKKRKILRLDSSHRIHLNAEADPESQRRRNQGPKPQKMTLPPPPTLVTSFEKRKRKLSPVHSDSESPRKKVPKRVTLRRTEFDPVAAGREYRREKSLMTPVLTDRLEKLHSSRAEQRRDMALKSQRAHTSFEEYRLDQKNAEAEEEEVSKLARQIHLPVFTHSKALC